MSLRSLICILTFVGIILPTIIAQASQDPPSEDYTWSVSTYLIPAVKYLLISVAPQASLVNWVAVVMAVSVD